MKRHEQDELLKELLTGEEVADFRRVSLERGLAALQRRKRFRRAAQFGTMVALALLVTIGIVHQRKSKKTTRDLASVKRTSETAATSPAPVGQVTGVKTITDEELFALFPGRSMALVGKPGEQRLVFLDGGNPGSRSP